MGGTPFLTAFLDLNKNRDANETAAEFVRSKIRYIVKNKNVSEKFYQHILLVVKDSQ